MITARFILAAASISVAAVVAYEDTCTQFKDIYSSGTELCEVMWDGAFTVVPDDEPGYTMWFFDHENNPNDATTRQLFGDDTVADMCHLNYFHKDGPPSPEGTGMTECHPWKNNACCNKETVGSVDQINEAYGEGYEWDRCGPMTQACERFFVMEACLYECEPAAGLFRKHTNATNNPDYNEWQMEGMPIKQSFCNAWYDACYNDYFCGQGSYFGCQEYYEQNLEAEKAAAAEAEKKKQEEEAAKLAAEEQKKAEEEAIKKAEAEAKKKEEEAMKAAQAEADRMKQFEANLLSSIEEDSDDDDKKFNTGLVIGLAVTGALTVVAVSIAGLMFYKEKQGEAIFAPVKSEIS